MKFSKIFLQPIWLLIIFCTLAYYPFFLQGKVPFPGDVVVGAANKYQYPIKNN
jgi:hypothetical protein